MIGGITFKEDTHQYFDESGNEIPSVTQILKVAGLINYGKTGTELQDNDYMLRGKAAHKAIHLFENFKVCHALLKDKIIDAQEYWQKRQCKKCEKEQKEKI